MVGIAHTTSLMQSFTHDPSLAGTHVWLDPTLGLVTGTFPKALAKFDFTEERLVALTDTSASHEKKRISHLPQARRVVKRYELETDKEIHLFGSATQLLVEGLNLLEELTPGTLEKFSRLKGRSKRAVAKSRDELYDLPRPEKYSQQLKSGFYVATNNKDSEARGFLRQAAEFAGFKWGKNFVVRAA